MPRYFFHVYDDIETIDEEGFDFPDLGAARAEALRSARSLAGEQVTLGRLNLSHRIDIADAEGRLVESVRFADALAVTQ